MNAEFIRSILHRQPFEPFEIAMSNGDRYLVKHPELAMLAGARLIVYEPETDRVGICSLLHINNINTKQAA